MANNNQISRFVYSTLVLFIVWIFLTGSFQVQELMIGVIASLAISLISYKYISKNGLKNIRPKKILYFLIYIPYFLSQVIKANIDVAYRVLHPKRPINPGIVKIKTDLKSSIGKLALANSITLTPGTMSVDAEGDYLYIHWIDVEDSSVEKASEEISKPFEKYLKKVFP